MWPAVFVAAAMLFTLATCGGGGSKNPPPPPDRVTITGMVAAGEGQAVPDASCSFVDENDQTLVSDDCDQNGRYELRVTPGQVGYVYCGPKNMPSLNLATVVSTVGAAAGDILDNENVTPQTTVAADIIRFEKPTDPDLRKLELMQQMDQDPNLSLVATLAGRLYRAMLKEKIDTRFGDDHSGGDGNGNGGDRGDSGGVGGEAGDGADFSPLPDAVCSFVVGDDFGNSEHLYPAALADFIADGELDRPDLAALAREVMEGLEVSPEEIVQAFEAWFPDGLGALLTDVTDEEGKYFLPIPANLEGYVRCVPRGRQALVLATHIAGRPVRGNLEEEDVNPASTVFSLLIAPQLEQDIGTVKENFLADIEGLETKLVLEDGDLTGFRVGADTQPADKDVGLVAFSATALFNTFYKNDLDVDFLAALNGLAENQSVDEAAMAALGVPSEEIPRLTTLLDGSLGGAERALDADLTTAFSKARINVTVMGAPDGDGLIAGAAVDIDNEEVTCEAGCGQETDSAGQLTLTLGGVPEAPATEVTVVVSSVEGYAPYSVTTEVVAFATVDLDIVLPATSYRLSVQGAGDGSGRVTSTPGGIDCGVNGGAGTACNADFASGSSITLTATPDAGALFDSWGGACTGTDATCTVTMAAMTSVRARFSQACDAEDYTVSVDPTTFGSEGGSGTIRVTAPDGCPWQASTTSEGLSVAAPGGGSGSGTLRFSYGQNPAASPREGTITVVGQPHEISQAAAVCTYTLLPEERGYTAAGGSGSLRVEAPQGCRWQASSDSGAWLQVTAGDSGSGDGNVSYEVLENPATSPREGLITVGDGTATATHRVSQGAADCRYSVTPVSRRFGPAAETSFFDVTAQAGCAWTATPNQSWVTVLDNSGSGTGNGRVRYQVRANATASTRTATFGLTNSAATHTVTQTADTTAPSPDPMTWATAPAASSTTAIVMTATAATDPTTPVSYQFDHVASPTDGGTGGSDADWRSGRTFTDTGLQVNRRYGYRVRANDGNGNATGYSTTAYAYTLANPPGAGAFSDRTQTAIRANWTANGNPAGTEYECQIQIDGTWEGSGWITATSWNRTGLTCGTAYAFRVRARNGDNATTAWVALDTAETSACPDTTAPTPNPMTWATAPAAASTTAITMTATEARDPVSSPVSYQFDYVASPTDGGTGGTDTGWRTGRTYTDTGLQVNRRYGYRVRANDAAGNDTDYSGTVYAYTLARPPGTGAFSDATPTSIRANWTVNGNPSGTEYECQVNTGSRWESSGWITATSWNRTGLSCGRSYAFRVRARNGDDRTTAWVDLGEGRTADCPDTTAPTPNPMTWSTAPRASTTTAITMTATTATDSQSPPVTYQFDYVASTTNGGTGGTDSNWQTGRTYTDSGLQVNRRYGYRVRAQDRLGNPTDYSNTVFSYTLANLPGYAQFSGRTRTSIRANWTANGNPAGTEYQCQNMDTGEFSSWTTNTYWVDSGLTCGTAYEFQVRARNGDDVMTSWRALDDTSTLACPPVVSVSVIDATAAEASEFPDHGAYRISRTGSTASRLAVYFSMGGTATGGEDYVAFSSPVYIPSGSSFVDVDLTVLNDWVDEPNETARLTISTNSAYVRGSSYIATITILDDDRTLLINCPMTDPGGDHFDRGFYVSNYQGHTLRGVNLYFGTSSPGRYAISLTAREGSYGGRLVGTSTVNADLNETKRAVYFSFLGAPAVNRGSILTFDININTSNYISYSVGTNSGCPVVQTNDTNPPLDTFRRNGIAVLIWGDSY